MRPRSLRGRGHTRPSGFTLIEVMGAVVLLGFAYVMIVEANIQALRAESEAARYIEADILADAQMDELELALLQNKLPFEESREEKENDPYLLVTEISPFEFTLPEAFSETPEEAAPPPEIYQIEVRVSWGEGDAQKSVVRRTFAAEMADAMTEAPGSSIASPNMDNPFSPEARQ